MLNLADIMAVYKGPSHERKKKPVWDLTRTAGTESDLTTFGEGALTPTDKFFEFEFRSNNLQFYPTKSLVM
jgi:hypothetical protein